MKAHLLFELKEKFPDLSLSFSSKDFISMKGSSLDKAKIARKKIIYALRVGIFKSKSEVPASDLEFIKLKENEFWNYKILNRCFDFLPLYPSPAHPVEAPARAYSKIHEANDLFELNLCANDIVVEIGSAPGGITYFLLHLGARVVAIDPAEMDKSLEKMFSSQFSHIKKSIFDVNREELPKNTSWVISDLNLHGDLNTAQSARIMKMFAKLKGAFLTIKTPNPSDYKKIIAWKQVFTKNFHVEVINLPAHKKEIGFILKKKA